MSNQPGNETKSRNKHNKFDAWVYSSIFPLPVVLCCSYKEKYVGDDEDRVAEYLAHHVPGVVRHPVPERLMIGL